MRKTNQAVKKKNSYEAIHWRDQLHMRQHTREIRPNDSIKETQLTLIPVVS